MESNPFMNLQNVIDLREINTHLKTIMRLTEENIALKKIIADYDDDET